MLEDDSDTQRNDHSALPASIQRMPKGNRSSAAGADSMTANASRAVGS